MMLTGLLGRRVVLRYRRADPGDQPPLSDLVGELTTLTEDTATVHTRRGPVTIQRAQVELARAVAPDRRQILELERIAGQGWRAAETAPVDGWLLRADRGWTGRANSALPLHTPTRPVRELIQTCEEFYRARGLTPQVQVPMPARELLDAELAATGWALARPTVVLTRTLVEPPDSTAFEVEVATAPGPSWLANYHYRGGQLPETAVALLTRHDNVRFVSLRAGATVLGIARAAVDEGWLGVTAVEVAPEQRRRGVATGLMHAVIRWGLEVGASQCYLQVDADNAGALAFYANLGFTEHHRYHYRTSPEAG